jgi:hypothetical protein
VIVKEWFMNGFDWIKTKIMENKLRTGALLCLLLALAGFFLPFMSAKMSASVTGIMTNTLEVISPEYDMINFSLSDFVLQEPIDEFEIYGVPLGNIKVLDQSVLDILRSPLPDKGYVSSINEALASPALDYLVDPQVQQIVITRFNNGEAINGIPKVPETLPARLMISPFRPGSPWIRSMRPWPPSIPIKPQLMAES